MAFTTASQELARVLSEGGAEEETQIIRDTTTGPYREFVTGAIRHAKEAGLRVTGPIHLTFLGGHLEDDRVLLVVCEDVSQVVITDADGTSLPDPRFYRHDATAVYESGHWKIFDVSSEPLPEADGC